MSSSPTILYHYTTQAGLLGILGSDSLWATKIHYLNDSSEYQLAFELAIDVLRKLQQGERSTRKRTKIKCLLENLREIEHMNVCVCSFSAHGDLLSQWRAYAGETAGYSIGFHVEHLKERAKEQGYSLVRCVYNEGEQRELIEQVVTAALDQDFNTRRSRVDPTRPRTIIVLPTGGDFAKRFAQLAPLIKSSAFYEEAEWRLVSDTGVDVRTMCFRPGKSMLVPYVPFTLGAKKGSYLEGVTVGPTPHKQLSEYAIHSLLARWRCAHPPKVRCSKIPFRAW